MNLSTILMNLTESAGKEDPATQPRPPGCLWGQVRGMYPGPKDSNGVVGVRDCNREGARGG